MKAKMTEALSKKTPAKAAAPASLKTEEAKAAGKEQAKPKEEINS